MPQETQTLAAFIAEHHIAAKAQRIPMRHDAGFDPESWGRDEGRTDWNVTLTRGNADNGHGYPGEGYAEMLVPFSHGSAHTKPPTAEDVLNCLILDSSGYDNARNFEDWASDYGYDTDSRKAEAIYRTVAEQAKALRHFLGADYDAALACELL